MLLTLDHSAILSVIGGIFWNSTLYRLLAIAVRLQDECYGASNAARESLCSQDLALDLGILFLKINSTYLVPKLVWISIVQLVLMLLFGLHLSTRY